MADARRDWGRLEGEGAWPEENRAQLLSESVIEVGSGIQPPILGDWCLGP